MIQELKGREKVQAHIIANKVNEIIEAINKLEFKTDRGENVTTGDNEDFGKE